MLLECSVFVFVLFGAAEYLFNDSENGAVFKGFNIV